jgi:Thoeris protein ThsA, Macro domain
LKIAAGFGRGQLMLRPSYATRQILGTARGGRLLTANLLVAFGLVSAIVQFVGQLFPHALPRAGPVTLSSLGICLLWALFRAYPRASIERDFGRPEMRVSVRVGDLFDQDAHLIVGFSDTFDTSTRNSRVINPTSVQGQLLHRLYGGDRRRLDKELAQALSRVAPQAVETRQSKRSGKLQRYAIGTVAVVGEPHRRVFAVAYSRMGNDLVAQSTVEDLWSSLSRLWDAVYLHGQRGRVAIPLLGSELARIDALDRESALRMILLSFVTRSRENLVARELTLVIWPPDLEKIDLLEVKAFLYTL